MYTKFLPRLTLARVLGCVLTWGGLSSAADDDSSERTSRAQTLFDEARQLMESLQFAEACSKLAMSYQLDPATGTLLNLALCREREGKLASAYRAYAEALERAVQEGNHTRQRFAEERQAALSPLLSHVTIHWVHEPSAEEWVNLDGVLIEPENIGVPLSVDSGTHTLVHGAAHRPSVTQTIEVTRAGQELSIPISPLSANPIEGSVVLRKTHQVVLQSRNTRRVSTAVVASYGVAGLGAIATAYFGIRTFQAWDDRNELCKGGCTDAAQHAGERAYRYGWAADVAGGIAILGAGIGTFLLFESPPSRGSNSTVWVAQTTDRGATIGAQLKF